MDTDSIRHPLTRTLLVLTLTTGVIDAACYLGLGHVFAANMTGNVVLLGFGIVGSGRAPGVRSAGVAAGVPRGRDGRRADGGNAAAAGDPPLARDADRGRAYRPD